MLQQTSLETYRKIKKEGTLSNMQMKVYAVIKDNPRVTDKQISQLTKLPINCVTPRRGELARMGMVSQAGITYSETNKPCLLWVAN